MVTYDFYKNVYLGSAITEPAFPGAIARAGEWLDKLERTCTVTDCGPNSRAMAVCAVAEAMDTFSRRQQVSRASIGGVTVEYADDSDKKLSRQLLQTAGIFLDIYRGVGK